MVSYRSRKHEKERENMRRIRLRLGPSLQADCMMLSTLLIYCFDISPMSIEMAHNAPRPCVSNGNPTHMTPTAIHMAALT